VRTRLLPQTKTFGKETREREKRNKNREKGNMVINKMFCKSDFGSDQRRYACNGLKTIYCEKV
jgi:hypothetical protein